MGRPSAEETNITQAPGLWSLAGYRMLPCNQSLAPGGRAAMDVTDKLEDHQAHCLPHLLTLRMLAGYTPEPPLPWLAVAEVTQATGAILAEVEAAVRAVTGGGPGSIAGPGIGIFLGVRLSRLAAAADDAIAAAGAGDFTQLRTHLRRFETLTSAIWAVQDASH
jgi:hypothetical protein